MSDLYAQRDQVRRLEQTQVVERNPLYLPWGQRVVNPFPLASSGGLWGDSVQPWNVYVLAFYAGVFVNTTNNGTNFWTLNVLAQPSGATVASVTTAAISANTWTRISDLTITQPSSTDVAFGLQLVATLSPGSIYVAPALALLRTGN